MESRRTKGLKQLRLSRKLTQSAFADIVGATQASISEWEKLARPMSMESAQAIADALNVACVRIPNLSHWIFMENQDWKALTGKR